MSEEHERKLERTETWDFEQPEVKEPVRPSRVVVSVAFRREDFSQVSVYAERLGKRTSEFIREAAIEKATGGGAWTLEYGGGSSRAQWWPVHMPSFTVAIGSRVDSPEKTPATTY